MIRPRDYPWLALLCLLLASRSYAQVTITTVTTITCDTPDATAYRWYADAGLTLTPVGNGQAVHPSGPDGTYDGVVVATVPGDKIATAWTVRIGDTPEPPPVPPVVPLRNLVTAAEAKQLSAFCLAFIDELATLQTPEAFWKLFDEAVPVKNAALDAALRARLNPVLASNHQGVSAELRAIAAELATEPKPPKPPVVEGKRQVILLREAGDMTPELNTLVARLQSVGPDYDYLRSKGHIVRVYDDEQRANGEPIPLVEKLAALNPLPELYILDEQGNIIANLNIDPDSSDGTPATTAGQVVEFARQHGG